MRRGDGQVRDIRIDRLTGRRVIADLAGRSRVGGERELFALISVFAVVSSRMLPLVEVIETLVVGPVVVIFDTVTSSRALSVTSPVPESNSDALSMSSAPLLDVTEISEFVEDTSTGPDSNGAVGGQIEPAGAGGDRVQRQTIGFRDEHALRRIGLERGRLRADLVARASDAAERRVQLESPCLYRGGGHRRDAAVVRGDGRGARGPDIADQNVKRRFHVTAPLPASISTSGSMLMLPDVDVSERAAARRLQLGVRPERDRVARGHEGPIRATVETVERDGVLLPDVDAAAGPHV